MSILSLPLLSGRILVKLYPPLLAVWWRRRGEPGLVKPKREFVVDESKAEEREARPEPDREAKMERRMRLQKTLWRTRCGLWYVGDQQCG